MDSNEIAHRAGGDSSNSYISTAAEKDNAAERPDEQGGAGAHEGIPEDAELEELRRVRRALGKMNQGLENVQHQIKYFNSNVSQTTQLLDIWVRILSQTAHNHAFLSNEDWQGGGIDSAKLSDLARRDLERQQEASRRAREAEAQRARQEAEAKERERQRAELAAAAAAATATANSSQSRQPLHTRSGRIQGRQAQSGGGYGRGRLAAVSASGGTARGGRGRGRGSSIPPPTVSGRERPPRR
ncbi:hypothetical protein H4217_000317 [Coemansia sp. RSA 1939]|nr:hypothetical protein H4217_000317 [Coemansia sp. RSA 1939]KAJ2616102.1 hypothetical protein EV177_001243 [Coemansia sp. RSA 1804]KAJ2685725.1 hypothetical protein GGH99_003675 [Coemansia sp. RSA 1285]